jgi:gamma-glutamyltranspeptidase/glutathione hydrolase
MKRLYLVLIFLISVLSSCNEKHSKTGKLDKSKHYKGMVVSARKEASDIGIQIMQQGGNAFDAMLATELALAIVHPCAGNLGGGGFMVYRLKNGETGTLDYREKAPLNSSKTMYLNDDNTIIENESKLGIKAVGVPGTVKGVFKAHKRFGILPTKEVLKPVIALAKNGYVITTKQYNRIKEYDSILRLINGDQLLFKPDIKIGDTIVNTKLAETLSRLAVNGSDDFYTGESSKKLLDFISNKSGIINAEDLKSYDAIWRVPLTFTFKNYTIHSMGPPSSGGIVLGQILKMISPYLDHTHTPNSISYVKLLVEAEKRAYADRSYYLGDPDFVNIPKDKLLDSKYLSKRLSEFALDSIVPSSKISYGNTNFENNESSETTHYSIVDPQGNAVSVTTTLNSNYGSKVFVPELGIFLNNEMDDFSVKPGSPNDYGLIGGQANSIQPQKRMLSSMTPTIVEKNNALFLVVGSPGGSTIITSVLQTILNVIHHHMPIQKAVDYPRFHHQWLPDEIKMESKRFNDSLKTILLNLGYKFSGNKNQTVGLNQTIGKVDAIIINEDKSLSGGADHRGDDHASGF